jgi:para-nitrobenzyl esterase
MTRLRRLAGAFAAVLMTLASPAHAQPGPLVDPPAGAMQGQADGAVRVFKGIPYAQPPVGAARWTPPRPLSRWQGTREATEFGPACVQPTQPAQSLYADDIGPMSEDCLTLNVWAPADARGAPVLVWIHGGSLISGASREAIYGGANLARHGVIVVSINYRLGVLGYLAHPQLSAQSPDKVSGNYGLLDQIEALRWIQRNIAAFGGDPANVTIAGQSAGGLSVLYLMVSQPARGLFAKAIAESSYAISTAELRQAKFGAPAAEAIGVYVMGKLGAATINDLRAMDASQLTYRAAALGYAPSGVVDGRVLPRQLVDAFDRGEQAPVPLLVGFNSGEIRSLRVLAPRPPASAADYERTIRDRYGDLAGAFLALYPSSNLEESIIAATRDGLYGWTAERLALKQTTLGQRAYLYLFDHGYPAEDTTGLHAFHASEVPFVFGTADRLPPHWPTPPVTPAEASLSEAMMAYWASFARTGSPRASGQPGWPAYDANHAYMAFKDTPLPSDHLLPGMYELHEQAVCRRREHDLPWYWNVGLLSPRLPAASPACR